MSIKYQILLEFAYCSDPKLSMKDAIFALQEEEELPKTYNLKRIKALKAVIKDLEDNEY